jgi:hypothetical protein
MDAIIEQGIVGIVTGILTTAILFLLKNIWITKAVPFLTTTRYQGVQIDGQWTGSSENSDPQKGDVYSNEANLYLDQRAHDLSGLFIFSFKNEKKSFTLEFNVKGYIWEGYVTLNFTPKDRRVTSYATALLKLHDGGCLLLGDWLFRNVETEFVNSTPLSLGRNLRG